MSSAHASPTIVDRVVTLPPHPANPSPTSTGTVVSIDINKNTVVTVFGIINDTVIHDQKVTVQLYNADVELQASTNLDGVKYESYHVNQDKNTKTITWGPFTAKMKVELIFYYKTNEGWKIHQLKKGEIKEFADTKLETHVSLIPVIHGPGSGTVRTIANVTRMTLT